MKANSPILYPNVTRVPGSNESNDLKKSSGGEGAKPGEFDALLKESIQTSDSASLRNSELKQPAVGGLNSSVPQGLKFSAHASQRLRERQINLDPETMTKMNDAITKADSKGVQDTLVLTKDAAMIVSVPNRTVITAMDRAALEGNVFTNIDGAVII